MLVGTNAMEAKEVTINLSAQGFQNAEKQENSEATIHDLGTLNSVEETAPDSFTPIIVLCASAAVAAAVIGFIIYQIKNKKKNDSSDD